MLCGDLPYLAVSGWGSVSGITTKIHKTAHICFFPWPERLPEVAAPPGAALARECAQESARSPLPGPSAHINWEWRAGICQGQRGKGQYSHPSALLGFQSQTETRQEKHG